jgi:hypothetical protein
VHTATGVDQRFLGLAHEARPAPHRDDDVEFRFVQVPPGALLGCVAAPPGRMPALRRAQADSLGYPAQ